MRKLLRSIAFKLKDWLSDGDKFANDDRISIGVGTYGSPNFRIWLANDKVQIGKYCSIAANVVIFGGGEHNYKFVSTYPLKGKLNCNDINTKTVVKSKGITLIANDVWIGEGAMILSGVKIGNGAVIGARSLVTKDVPDYAIVGGNPAKIIKYRFEKETIKQLLMMKWWDWSKDKIKKNVHLISSENVNRFCQKFAKE
jgi:acetyltransferase-like isoleucine patch superfamily enzyme